MTTPWRPIAELPEDVEAVPPPLGRHVCYVTTSRVLRSMVVICFPNGGKPVWMALPNIEADT